MKSRKQDAIKALAPFADIGQWLFARPDVPDTEVVVVINGLNGAQGNLTRGDFKAAFTARQRLVGAIT